MMPLAATANSHFLTYASCGAWSQAIASIVPSWIPSRIAIRSSSPRSGGFIFAFVSYPSSAASVRVKY